MQWQKKRKILTKNNWAKNLINCYYKAKRDEKVDTRKPSTTEVHFSDALMQKYHGVVAVLSKKHLEYKGLSGEEDTLFDVFFYKNT
uniref:Uncharacterized protein n=1 Tax=Glossina morsitans morsitans TaxID=37546 RepID=A0A1B0FG69_GLOMM